MVHPLWDSQPYIKEQLHKVQEIMLRELTPTHSDVLATVREYILSSGKFIRAGLCLQFAHENNSLDERALYRAASIEVLHLATLVHDDVIDAADTRRNLITFHKKFDNRVAIYAGDYLLAYSARLAKKGAVHEVEYVGNDRILELVLSGELRQLMNQFNTALTINGYLKQIRGKTAQLFGLAAQAGVVSKGVSAKRLNQAYQAGIALGMAFQLQDDLIDYESTLRDSGKPRFQDVQNGIYTAPLLLSGTVETWKKYIRNGVWTQEDMDTLYAHIQQSGAIEKTKQLIHNYQNRFSKRVMQVFPTCNISQFNAVFWKLF